MKSQEERKQMTMVKELRQYKSRAASLEKRIEHILKALEMIYDHENMNKKIKTLEDDSAVLHEMMDIILKRKDSSTFRRAIVSQKAIKRMDENIEELRNKLIKAGIW